MTSKNTTIKKTQVNKTNLQSPLLEPLKWISMNILLPFLPILIKMFTNHFSTAKTEIWEPNDLLYYNFFICILLINLLKQKNNLFSYIVTIIAFILCIFDILLIAFIATGQQNILATRNFAICTAIVCASFGSAYVIMQRNILTEGENK